MPVSSLTRDEMETSINFNEAEKVAVVYTYNAPLKRKLARFSGLYPDMCQRIKDDGYGGETWQVPKKWIKVSAPPCRQPMTPEQRAAASARMAAMREKKVKRGERIE